MTGILKAIRSDLFLALTSRGLVALVLLAPAAAAARIALGKLRAAGLRARDAMVGGTSVRLPDLDGYGALVDGLSVGLALTYLLVVAIAAHSCAADRERGHVRRLLLSGVGRPAWVVGRYLFLLGLATAVVLSVAAASLGAASLLHRFSPAIEDGYELIGVAEIHREILLGIGLALVPLPAAVALGVLVSVCARTPAGALAGGPGISVGFDLFKPLLGGIAPYVHAFYHPSLADGSYLREVSRLVRGFSDVFVEPGFFARNLWVPWPWAAALLAVAVAVAWRREL